MKVTSNETGQTRTAITQSNGTYLVPLLPLGEYRLETSAKGFKTVTFQNIPIHVTETALLDIHLQVGAITETVTVNDVPELVQTGQYDASYGRNEGANVDVVTKSGTNAFHGDVWEYFRNTALNANDYFVKQSEAVTGQPNKAPVLNQNQFGFTLGGPVIKKKV